MLIKDQSIFISPSSSMSITLNQVLHQPYLLGKFQKNLCEAHHYWKGSSDFPITLCVLRMFLFFKAGNQFILAVINNKGKSPWFLKSSLSFLLKFLPTVWLSTRHHKYDNSFNFGISEGFSSIVSEPRKSPTEVIICEWKIFPKHH